MSDPAHSIPATNQPWYAEITRYQWMVLAIASAGWIFDVFEGQIFVASMKEAMPSLVPSGTDEGLIKYYNNVALAGFLLGGALGGIFFGMLSDRIGRRRTLSISILFYSIFTALSIFSQEWWHFAFLRFLVGLGTGGEWAVASALVAEVIPRRGRAQVGSIFHASSTLGSYMAVAVAAFLIGNKAVDDWATGPSMDWVSQFFNPATLPWRLGFAIGLLPSLLVLWIRIKLRDPERWQAARARAATEQASEVSQLGSIGELFRGRFLRRTVIGIALATVGLSTFWGTFIYGRNTLRVAKERSYLVQSGIPRSRLEELDESERKTLLAHYEDPIKRWEMLGMFLVTTGGGLGLLAFGPLSQRIGRRGAFLFFQAGGLISSLLVFQVITGLWALVVVLPIFGFLALGMHAGFAVYFPELYPTRLRGSGAGVCFNGARFLAAPILIFNGWMLKRFEITQFTSAALFSLLFIVGMLILPFAPETRGRELPE